MRSRIGKKLILASLGGLLLTQQCTYDQLPGPADCSDLPVVQVTQVEASDCGESNGSFRLVAESSIPLEVSLNGGPSIADLNFRDLAAGTYQVLVKTEAGCEIALEVEIPSLSGLLLNLVVNDADCGSSNGNLEVQATGGQPPYRYRLDEGSLQDSGNFTSLAPGLYTVTAIDANGCTFGQTVEIKGSVAFSEIKAIVNANCAVSGCHAGNVSPDFRNDDNIRNRAGRIAARTSSRTMPPSSSGKSLSQAEIDLISCWAETLQSN
jgi:hypothetical protein